jgi:hypothetical protein
MPKIQPTANRLTRRNNHQLGIMARHILVYAEFGIDERLSRRDLREPEGATPSGHPTEEKDALSLDYHDNLLIVGRCCWAVWSLGTPATAGTNGLLNSVRSGRIPVAPLLTGEVKPSSSCP